MLLQFALTHYHVPLLIRELMFNYYECLIGRVHTEKWISNWFGFEIGLFQGCTASTINFDVAFQPILDIVLEIGGEIGYNFKEANLRVPPLVYADDVEFITSTPSQNQQYLDGLDQALQWTRKMKAKPSKCRSLAFRQFKFDEKRPLDTLYSYFDPKKYQYLRNILNLSEMRIHPVTNI
jgi:hypothetical protein